MTQPLISVLLPTLGRPGQLIAAVASLLEAGAMPEGTELLIGFQEDDPAITTVFDTAPGVRTFRWPAFPTLARKVNRLAEEATGAYLMAFANDMAVAPGWSRIIRDTVTTRAETTIFHILDGPNPDFTLLPLLHRRMIATTGFFCAPWFPFWFTDTWWDEIGTLIDSKHAIDIGLTYPAGRGRSQGLRDLAFWTSFLNLTRPMRLEAARRLIGPIPPERILTCEQRVAHLGHADFIAAWENNADPIASPRYLEALTEARALLQRIGGMMIEG